MKLFFSPGACSLAPHIVLRELGLPFEAIKVDLRAKTYAGGDYRQINVKGSVPAVVLANGDLLTEGAILLQYLADQKPESGIFPKVGTMERVHAQEWLHYVSTEIHKTFSILFAADRWVKNSEGNQELKASVSEALNSKMAWLSSHLEKSPFLTGASFSLADAYLFVCLRWAGPKGFDLNLYPALKDYFAKIGARASVQAALEAEGLKPA